MKKVLTSMEYYENQYAYEMESYWDSKYPQILKTHSALTLRKLQSIGFREMNQKKGIESFKTDQTKLLIY